MKKKPPPDDTSWEERVDHSPTPQWNICHADSLIQWIKDLIQGACIPALPHNPATDSQIVK
ncbi:MAG: hypothetical protein ABSB42_10760 [Tepidisphaeraceae bacterium]|jgi:hypothetical protein